MDYTKTLSNVKNQIINILLIKPQPFGKIAMQITIDPVLLREEIKTLELEGIVQNFLQKLPGETEFSFFEITEYGKKLLTLNYNPK